MTEEELKRINDEIERLKKIKRTDNNIKEYSETQCLLAQLYHYDLEDYDKAKEHYLNVPKRKACLELYANAQCRLARLYHYRIENYEKAKEHYLNVLKEDSAEWYAEAQCRLAELYHYVLKDYGKAKEHYLNVPKRKDFLELYAEAQFRLALLYHYRIENYEKAKEHYLNVSKEDSTESYANAQCRLAQLYNYDLKDYDKAKEHYLNVLKEDSAEWYAEAQCRLAQLYNYDLKDYDKAKEHYLNILKEDSAELYANAQCQLAQLYNYDLKDYEKALDYYSNVLKEDSPELYVIAQYELGCLSLNLKEYIEAKKYFQKVTHEDINKYNEAQLYIKLIDENKNIVEFFEDIQHLLKILKNINICTQKIKDNLLVKLSVENIFEQKFAHYTNPNALFELLKNNSLMRLNLIDFMNDPTENKILFDWLEIKSIQKNMKIKSFLSSLSFNHNSLNQFRLYGLENNRHGSGVSIVLRSDFFCKEHKDGVDNELITHVMKTKTDGPNKQMQSEINKEKSTTENEKNIFPLPLYRCIYFDPKSKYIKISKRNKQSFSCGCNGETDINKIWKNYIKFIDEDNIIKIVLENLEKIKKIIQNSFDLIKKSNFSFLLNTFENLLHLSLMQISCLIKHSAFEDEDECRMMYTTHISDKKIKYSDDYKTSNTLYLEYSKINEYIDKIYLGPTCKSEHLQWIEYHSHKYDRIKIKSSKLPLQ